MIFFQSCKMELKQRYHAQFHSSYPKPWTFLSSSRLRGWTSVWDHRSVENVCSKSSSMISPGSHHWHASVCTVFSWFLFTCCSARQTVLCTTGEHIGYAAHNGLIDIDEHKLYISWFESANLIPLPDSGLSILWSRIDVDSLPHTWCFPCNSSFPHKHTPPTTSWSMLLKVEEIDRLSFLRLE